MRRPRNNPSKAQVWKWFLSLDVEERSRVLSIEDKECVQLIQKMHQRKIRDGEGLFFAVDDGFEDMDEEFPICANVKASNHIFTNKNDFCFKKLGCLDENRIINYPESLLVPDRELECALRLCDTREYLDTMTVATSLLEDPYHFLRLMERASRGSFLTAPCKVDYNTKLTQWVWDVPTWFMGMGFYSLGTYICHKLEQALWIRYWQSQSLDPRKTYGKRRYTFPYSNSQALLSKTHLTEFWINTEPLVRLQIIGGLGSIVDSALRDIATESSKEKTVLVPSCSIPPSNLRVSRKDYDAARNFVSPFPEIRLLSALVDFSMEKRAVEFLFASHPDKSKIDHRRFIEILYFSPLKTAGTPINFVLRRLGFVIQNAYTEKLSMDLIVGEKKKRIRGKRNKNKKKGNPKKILKRKLAASATVTTTTKKKSVKQQQQQPNNNTSVLSVDSTKDPPDKLIQSNSSSLSKDSTLENNELIKKDEVKKEEKVEVEKQIDEEEIKIEEVIEIPVSTKSKLETKLTIESAILRTANGKCKKKEEPENVQDDVENLSMSTNENDNSWVEVPIRSKKTKKKISIPKSNPSSAPVSPRTKLTQTKKVVRSRRSSSGPSLEHRRISVRPNQTKKENSESKELKNNRSKSSSSLTEMIPKESNPNSSNLITRSPPVKRIKIVPRVCQRNSPTKVDSTPNVTAARVRSASCSPQRTSTTSPRRSHSASARSRKSPVRKSVPTNESTQSPPGNKRVRIDKPNSTNTQQRRCRLYRTTNRQTQMHVLYTHEEEHEVANALSKEISSYVDYLKNIVRNHHLRLIDKIIQRVRCSVGSLWSSAVIRVYGSIATGLCIPESDLDLVVCIPDESVGGSPVLLLAAELKGKPWVDQIQAIYTAKVPVIKMVIDGLSVDITFDVRIQNQAIHYYAQTDLDHSNQSNSHTGINTTNYILQLKKDYPALEPLVLIIKQYLYCVLLNSSYTGGLASYSLVLMVASYLKFYGKSSKNLGTLLLGFFELYGKLFDYDNAGLSIMEPEGFFARDKNCCTEYGPAQLLIVDPLCPSNNIASGTFALYRVKQAFANGYNTLTERFSSPFIPSYLCRLLPIMLNNGYQPTPQC